MGWVLQKHITQYSEEYSETVETLLKNTYVDDVRFVSHDKEQLSKFKMEASRILQDRGFNLHKWHRNVSEAESKAAKASEPSQEDAITYVKTTVDAKSREKKCLGFLGIKILMNSP